MIKTIVKDIMNKDFPFGIIPSRRSEILAILRKHRLSCIPVVTEDKKELSLEMGDIIFTLICLANSQGIDLDESWKEVIDKCYGRDKDRYERKEPEEKNN